jgi:predicted transcriptional regulator of viral defense system
MYRIDVLLKQKRQLFHTSDLALLWKIDNKNTLYTTIKRYIKKGILISIHKGFYSTVPISQIDSHKIIQGYLHGYCYISCETVLFNHGVIFQKGDYITVVGDVSKKIVLENQSYFVRKLKDIYLYHDRGIDNIDGTAVASLERAVADMLYFNQKYFLDNRKVINWKKVKEIQKEVGYL